MANVTCSALYEPNADIAGIGIIISLVTHTCVYIILGMFIAPYIHLFFTQITPIRAENENDASGEKHEARKKLLYSRCRAAVIESYGAQHIIGLSFLIAGFIMHKQTSYYHVRMIHLLASILLASATVSEFNFEANSECLSKL
jgi:hypothetical protein